MDKDRMPEACGPLASNEQITEATAPSSKLFSCNCVRQWVPLAYREELYQVLLLTGPLLVSRILNFLLPFVITIFCGHLGNAELAGYALASATVNVTTTATGCGLALACDTLVSQTFGSKNLKRVGEILQRSILILLLFCLPCWAILINAESILLTLKQEPEVARIAQLYVMAFLPAVPAMFLHHLQVSYLQNQGIILPQMYTAVAANILNVATNYVLLHSMKLGVKGSAVANSFSQISICLLLFAYIRWKKLHVKTWDGWSRASLQEWGSYMKLAIPSTLMLCFEWWVYEIGGFLAGMLGEVDLGAQHVLLEVGSITYMFPLGVHAAACVRVGNALGAGDTDRALITSKVTLVISGVLAVLQGIVVGCSKSVVGYIFTSDESIVRIVSENLTLYVFLQFFDALVCVSSGILLGAGKQKIAALSNLICYYCIGLPVGISLMFLAELRILGLWLGLLICVIIQTCFFTTLIFKLDWKKATEQALKRAGKHAKVVCVQKAPSIGQTVMDTLVSEGDDSAQQTPDFGASASIPEPWDDITGNKAQLTSNSSEADGYVQVSTHEQGKPVMESESGEARPKVLLSTNQLVLRRGLTLLTTVLILIAGIAVHVACPLPESFIRHQSNLTMDSKIVSTLNTFLNTTASSL
ncbi:multidrug and toxin extrusion protein 1 [Pimephales promelas]|uniref:multidrug and toxin extrusion protein 1 n=1 Tax=Pimephales promelas TaxID=90988 RepID=UPI001955CB4D|nr:multidrug and toxin extrusion protein 1 [Pimephales promelas]KAG1940318.1 multidrug and toxin extrusion protein [Pimephales promelas]